MGAAAGRECSVCASVGRTQIDRDLLEGVRSVSEISRTYALSRQALLRHRESHISKSVAAAAERERQAAVEGHDDSLLSQARSLHKQAMALMGAAYRAGNLRAALDAVGRATKLLELQGRLIGEIGGDVTVNVNTMISVQDFRTFTVGVVQALADHPEAKAAVLKLLDG